MPSVSIRKGDRVRMIAGKDLGAEGRVLAVLPKRGKVVDDSGASVRVCVKCGTEL
jgi:ribosomal protein L24